MNSREEWSNGFDILVSSYKRFKDFDKQELLDSIEFNEHEKSFFLTQAQDELILSLYNGRNSSGNSLDGTEELRRYLSNLIFEASLDPITNTSGNYIGIEGSKSKFFTLPDNLWFITYESASISNGDCETHTTQEVIPVTQDEYHKVKKNPFRGPNSRRALRLDLHDGVIEIVSKYNITKYYLRYVVKPKPIVLENMPNEITVNGEGNARNCELHEALHPRILEIAVQRALASKGVTVDSKKDNNNNR